ncbi:hypothetical protein Tco_0918987, partial [Tanacetum coccineum]
FRNGDCRTGSQSDNTVSPHGFVIHGIEILKGNEKVTEIINVENWRIDNSRELRWIVSLLERNSSVSSTKECVTRSSDNPFNLSKTQNKESVWKKRLQETMTKLTLEEPLSMFMVEIAKRHDEHSNLIKKIQAFTDFALRNKKSSIKALEIQVRQMSIILHKKLSGNLQSLTKIKPMGNNETISTSVKADKPSIRRIYQYTVSNLQNRNLFFESKKMTLPSSNHLNDDYRDELKETDGEKDMEAHYTNAKPLGKSLPRKEKDPGRLGDLIPTKLIVKLVDRTVKRPKGIVKNVLVGTELEARLMGNALRKNRSHDPKFEDYIELSDLNKPLELRHDQVFDLGPTVKEGGDYPSFSNLDRKIHVNDAYNLRFFCMIGFEHVDANFFPLFSINVMSKKFYNSIMKDKLEYKGNNIVGALMNVPIFVGTFSIITDFAVLEDMDAYCDKGMGHVIVGEPFLKEVRTKARRFEGIITLYKGNGSVTYQMVRSHPRLKRHTNQQCNKISPLPKKVQDTDSYGFLLANKKCTVNAKVFRTILDICLRVEGVNFTDVPDDDTALTFLIYLGCKGPLNRHTNMFMDHMHQSWITLAAIINKCLSRKTASNDKLRKSRIDILWGMFNRENVDYPELIWEDFAYQIDHMKEKRSRHTPVEEVEVSEESDPKPAKRKTSSKRRVKKKVTLSADDNIISDDPDAALELAKSISQTKAEEAE